MIGETEEARRLKKLAEELEKALIRLRKAEEELARLRQSVTAGAAR